MAKIFTQRQARLFLDNMGIIAPTHKERTKIFQRAYNFGTVLPVTGVWDEQTSACARVCMKHGYKISRSFHWSEFVSPDTKAWKLDYRLLRGLEDLRKKKYTGGLRIISGYRSKAWNKKVGGVPGSRHTTGNASDIPAAFSWRAWPSGVRYINEIGYNSEGKVIHVAVNDNYTRRVFFKEG